MSYSLQPRVHQLLPHVCCKLASTSKTCAVLYSMLCANIYISLCSSCKWRLESRERLQATPWMCSHMPAPDYYQYPILYLTPASSGAQECMTHGLSIARVTFVNAYGMVCRTLVDCWLSQGGLSVQELTQTRHKLNKAEQQLQESASKAARSEEQHQGAVARLTQDLEQEQRAR